MKILEAMTLVPEDALLDIGCGDGCLLGMAGGSVRQRIGVVPTLEERSRLQMCLPDVTFLVGMAQSLPVGSDSVSKIVCNSVLLLLESESAVMAALREIARVAQPSARIWLGEIPAADESANFGEYCGTSVLGFLWHELSKKGPRALASAAKKAATSLAGGQTLILCSGNVFFATPEKFIRMAQQCGLHLISRFKHERLDRSGKIVESQFRYNYLFVK